LRRSLIEASFSERLRRKMIQQAALGRAMAGSG